MITVATSGSRIYRITRQSSDSSGSISLDYMDFSLDLSSEQEGTVVMIEIPYVPSLFTSYGGSSIQPSSSAYNLTQLAGYPISSFNGELFKLLYINVDPSDPVREMPSTTNFLKAYSVEGQQNNIQFIYYTLINGGQPVFTGYFGNVSFQNQYADTTTPSLLSIDTTQLVNTVSLNGTDYYIIKVTTTPNVIITGGTQPTSFQLTDTYTVNGIQYTLNATANGIAGVGFYVTLIIPSSLDPSIPDNGFLVQPSASIVSYTFVQKNLTTYQFLIVPVQSVVSMDLKITFVGPS